MSLAKSIAGFIISSLFVIFLYLTITSYTLGNSLQKENVKEFIQSQLNGEAASSTCDNVCSTESTLQQCEGYCDYVDVNQMQNCRDECVSSSQNPNMKQACIQSCLSRSNQTQQNIFNTIDDIYSKKLVSEFSLDDALLILKNFLLFLIVSIILGVSLFLVSEKPLSRIGNDLVVVAISSLAFAAIPMLIITPSASIVKIISDFLSQSLYQQLKIGIVLLIVGIILVIIGKKKNK